jgi:hypothetical protein
MERIESWKHLVKVKTTGATTNIDLTTITTTNIDLTSTPSFPFGNTTDIANSSTTTTTTSTSSSTYGATPAPASSSIAQGKPTTDSSNDNDEDMMNMLFEYNSPDEDCLMDDGGSEDVGQREEVAMADVIYFSKDLRRRSTQCMHALPGKIPGGGNNIFRKYCDSSSRVDLDDISDHDATPNYYSHGRFTENPNYRTQDCEWLAVMDFGEDGEEVFHCKTKAEAQLISNYNGVRRYLQPPH